jgi:uncharacterized protein
MSPRRLELIILPTEQCNFRCTYCYEDFEIGQMGEQTVAAIKQLILKRLPKLRHLELSWFGGEPLMAKEVVLELCAFAQQQCAQAGISFGSNMTTNAFGLDPASFDTLVQLGVSGYQISLDGNEDQHNLTRKLINGRGTFHKIWANLLAMRASRHSFNIMLRLHIRQDNVDSLRVLLHMIQDAFGDDPRFTIFMKAVGNWGGESVKQVALSQNPKEVIAQFNLELEAMGWFAARRNKDVAETGDGGFIPCYASKPNSFVIRADGRLAKCTVAFSDPRNHVGQINADGSLLIENEKMRSFMRGMETMDESTLGCPMRNMPKLETVQVIKFEKNTVLARPQAQPQPA